MSEKRPRRWWQFNITTLLLGVTLCAVSIAWGVDHWRITQERARIDEALRQVEAYDAQVRFREATLFKRRQLEFENPTTLGTPGALSSLGQQ